MRSFSWDNYRYVLAIHRCESISGAARSLGVNETTVSRRLAHSEQYFKTRLFVRRSTGLIATDAGQRLIERLNRVKAELDQTTAVLPDDSKSVSGSVKMACDTMLMSHMLVPRLGQLLSDHPDLSCQLVTRSMFDSLRDADIAVVPGSVLNGKGSVATNSQFSLGQIREGVFAARTLTEQQPPGKIPWVLLSDSMRVRNHQDELSTSDGGYQAARVSVESQDVFLSCVTSGLGKASLPLGIGRRDQRLVSVDDASESISVDLFCQFQPELIDTPRLAACRRWLESCVEWFEAA